MPNLVRMANQAIEEGKCCVIGLQSTGEARTQDVVAEKGEELDDFVSGPRVRNPSPTTPIPFLPAQCHRMPGSESLGSFDYTRCSRQCRSTPVYT